MHFWGKNDAQHMMHFVLDTNEKGHILSGTARKRHTPPHSPTTSALGLAFLLLILAKTINGVGCGALSLP